ncbi:zf-HC2 domain-containing protein [Robertmurraya kyonggiensis]|nr:zf-HC2 domain-containing protein [Robertmurraya kyonggiensis]
MKCSLIRDLLPLYVERDCSEVTNQLVKDHLENCSECHELYELMKSPIDVKGIRETISYRADSIIPEIWKKYYGRLLIKGIGLFLIVYIIVVTLLVLLK